MFLIHILLRAASFHTKMRSAWEEAELGVGEFDRSRQEGGSFRQLHLSLWALSLGLCLLLREAWCPRSPGMEPGTQLSWEAPLQAIRECTMCRKIKTVIKLRFFPSYGSPLLLIQNIYF